MQQNTLKAANKHRTRKPKKVKKNKEKSVALQRSKATFPQAPSSTHDPLYSEVLKALMSICQPGTLTKSEREGKKREEYTGNKSNHYKIL